MKKRKNAQEDQEKAENKVRVWLAALDEVPDVDPNYQAENRAAFLNLASETLQPVSNGSAQRRRGWKPWLRKEPSMMFSLARIMIVLAILLGGGGTSAAFASQAALPGDVLYGMKLALEDARIGLTTDPQAEISLLGELVNERIMEMRSVVEQGLPLSEQLQTRLANHLQLALQRSAELDDPALIQSMEQVRLRTEQQLRILEQLRQNASQDQDQALQQTERSILRIQSMAEGAILDPTTFRMRLGNERPETTPDQPDEQATGQQEQGGAQNGPGQANPGKGGKP